MIAAICLPAIVSWRYTLTNPVSGGVELYRLKR